MQVVAREKAVVVSTAKADCEVLVKQIVQDKRAADEQEKQVNAEAEKIGKEAADANEIARVVQAELDKALPALQAAEDALNVLTKKDISELKAYAKPPALVEMTLQGAHRAVCLSVRKQLGRPAVIAMLGNTVCRPPACTCASGAAGSCWAYVTASSLCASTICTRC